MESTELLSEVVLLVPPCHWQYRKTYKYFFLVKTIWGKGILWPVVRFKFDSLDTNSFQNMQSYVRV